MYMDSYHSEYTVCGFIRVIFLIHDDPKPVSKFRGGLMNRGLVEELPKGVRKHIESCPGSRIKVVLYFSDSLSICVITA
jgi:hypothetical protein